MVLTMHSLIPDQSQINDFHNSSVLFIKSLFPASLCSDIRKYIVDHEQDIIAKYLSDSKGLVVENINGVDYIKYFEFPLHYHAAVFGKLLNSTVYKVSELLLKEPVHFISAEIHSRFPGATDIPPHQDNAYYGLISGKGLTFYIALDNQSVNSGGLQYLSNSSDLEYEHIASTAAGFSLEIANKSTISALPVLSFDYTAGDATIHHSRSVHRATKSPSDSSRSIVIRFSLYASSDSKKLGHDQWYRSMINLNRQSL